MLSLGSSLRRERVSYSIAARSFLKICMKVDRSSYTWHSILWLLSVREDSFPMLFIISIIIIIVHSESIILLNNLSTFSPLRSVTFLEASVRKHKNLHSFPPFLVVHSILRVIFLKKISISSWHLSFLSIFQALRQISLKITLFFLSKAIFYWIWSNSFVIFSY